MRTVDRSSQAGRDGMRMDMMPEMQAHLARNGPGCSHLQFSLIAFLERTYFIQKGPLVSSEHPPVRQTKSIGAA